MVFVQCGDEQAEVYRLINEGVISGGMIPKITACLKALEGVPCVHIVDGSEPHILLHEIDCKQRGTFIIRNGRNAHPVLSDRQFVRWP